MKNLLKTFSKNKFKQFSVVIVLLLIYIILSACSYSFSISEDLSESILRLHVIANSDSKEDQELKYKVRDNILNYMNSLCINISTKEEAIAQLNTYLDDFKKIAKQTITENGYDYDVNVKIGNYDFPQKKYGDIILPCGNYDALRVEIGNSAGQNWWCVMFPPLCFVDVSSGVVPDESKELLENSLNSEEYMLINETKSSDIEFKFKIIEIFQKVKITTAKN